MKLTCLFALVLAAAAQDGSGSGNDKPKSEGADQSQGAQDSGYGEQVESYGAPEYHYHVPSPKCCVSFCPSHSPFFSRESCACHAGIETYSAPAYYGESSYGEASDESSGYRQLDLVAPDNTIDTRRNVLNKAGTVVLWIVFGLFFLLGLYYIRLFSAYQAIGKGEVDLEGIELEQGLDQSIFHWVTNPSLIAGIVCLVASLAYLTMATGNGWYARCCDGRMFFFARYIDWVVTTPLMIHALCHYSNAGRELSSYLFFCDIIMIVTGLIASTICNGVKWVFFAFSMLAFLPVLYYIMELKDAFIDNQMIDSETGAPVKTGGVYLPYIWWFNNYAFLANLTVFAWFLYPIVWILAEGTGKISVTGEAICYAILDFIAKGIFGYFVANPEVSNVKDILALHNQLTNANDPKFKK
jgi:bacteriorhodopsin